MEAIFIKGRKKLLYGVNLTGPVTQMADQAKRLIDAGASCLLLNVFSYGLDVLPQLAADFVLYPSPYGSVALPVLLESLGAIVGAFFFYFKSPMC